MELSMQKQKSSRCRWQPQREPSPYSLTEIFSALAYHNADFQSSPSNIKSQLVYLRFDGDNQKVIIGRWWSEEWGFVTMHACMHACMHANWSSAKSVRWQSCHCSQHGNFQYYHCTKVVHSSSIKKYNHMQQFGNFRKKNMKMWQSNIVTQEGESSEMIKGMQSLMVLYLWWYPAATLLASNWKKRRQIRHTHLPAYVLCSTEL
jgi:hypothetical protein